MRHIISAFAAAALVSLGANAAASEKAEDEGSADRQMLAPNIVTPVVRDGKLVNYLFVTVKVDFSDKANALKVRDRAHFLRDALLKTSHRVPMADAAQDDKLNTAAAIAAFSVAAKGALGAENVKSVSIVGVDSLRRR